MPVLLSSISLFGKALFYTQFGMASIRAFDQAIEINPKQASGGKSIYSKGVSLEALKRYQEAIKSYEDAAKCGNKDAEKALLKLRSK
jgi:tetratricopeptide (TPR) repeat protein